MDQTSSNASVAAGIFTNLDTFAGITLIVYDYFLMFDKERRYIWKAKWNPGKVLFLIVHYLPVIDLTILILATSGTWGLSCELASYWKTSTMMVAAVFADCVYGLRTWALWNRNRAVGMVILSCGLGFDISTIVISLHSTFQNGSESPWRRIPGLFGCFLTFSQTDRAWIPYLLGTCFALVFLVATLLKSLQQWRIRPESITSVLYRDALLSFFAHSLMGVVNVILQLTMRNPDYALAVTFRALLSVIPSRIILNLREAVSLNGLDGWDVTRGPEVTEVTMDRQAGVIIED